MKGGRKSGPKVGDNIAFDFRFSWERKELMYPRDEGRHPTTNGPHPKFTDYAFDASEFHRIVRQAVDHVKQHPVYVRAMTPFLADAQSKTRDEL